MNTAIKQKIISWLDHRPKTRQWLWFIALWLSGLFTVLILAYPIKLLFKNLT